MASSEMLRGVALLTNDVSEERLIVTAKVVPSSLVLVTLMMEELRSFETSVFTRATRRNIPKDAILQGKGRSHESQYLRIDSCISEVQTPEGE
jgi:hypothetical protein